MDRTGDSRHYVRFLEHASGVEQLHQLKRRSYELMQVQVGEQVLGVGCGLGDDVRALAGLVGPTGPSVGIDASETMIAEARKRSEGNELTGGVRGRRRAPTGLRRCSFDACRIERTLQYMADPRRGHSRAGAGHQAWRPHRALEPDLETTFVSAGDKP